MIPKIKTVLYATDLSKNSAYAFRYAVNTASKHDARIHILHVLEPIPPQAKAKLLLNTEKKKLGQLQQAAQNATPGRIEERLKEFAAKELQDEPQNMRRIIGIHVVEGDPATEILKKTDELDCDTLIIGTHGKGIISRTLLGSVSEKILRGIRKPVYVIPLPKGKTDISMEEI